jgi:two-component system, NtrC family, sensor histidine kinase HydH
VFPSHFSFHSDLAVNSGPYATGGATIAPAASGVRKLCVVYERTELMTRAHARYLLAALVFTLPVILLVQALLAGREIDQMKSVYLRNRAAAVAGRLETLPAGEQAEERFDALAEEEPALVDVRVLEPQDSGLENSSLGAIWKGRELFRTSESEVDGQKVFRAYVPFHSPAGLRIARIDLAAGGADFLLVHARRNLTFAVGSGLVLWALALYVLLSARRMATLERRQLELEHLAHIGRLSAVLAHEIRNPLGTIKGFVQLATERGDPAVISFLEPVIQETLRLERLVKDLLLYGRPRDPVIAPVDWLSLAAEVTSGQAPPQGAARVLYGPEQWRIETDRDLLKQALLNLIRNSIEALEGREGEVRLSAAGGPRGGLTIRVTDTGPGIPPDVRSKLFQPFATTKASGTGLGLSIAKRLVESLGGTLRLQDGVPCGTTGEIVLPGVHAVSASDEALWKQSS